MWIAETFESDVGWSHLETLVDVDGGTGNRMAGSPGEREAARATRDALADAGARNARLSAFSIPGWRRGSSRVETAQREHDCIALPRSPSATVTAPLVDVGYGLPEDFDANCDGAVVMAASDVPDWHDRYVHRREKYYRAVEAGAAAFVYRNHVPGQLPPTGSVGASGQPFGPVPAVGVSKETGARLARRHDGEEVTVAVDAETYAVGDAPAGDPAAGSRSDDSAPDDPAADPTTSQNVRAELGPDADERVLVTSHVDAHDIAEGAMDNGFGTAMVVEVASALASRESDLDVPVEFVCFGAEEVGLLGSGHYAEAEPLGDVRAVVNLDFLGGGRTLKVSTHGFDALGTAARAVSGRFDHPVDVAPEYNPHSDHWPFVVRGVPGTMVASKSDDEGRGWGHTHADTLDKLDVRNLREGAVLVAELVAELADAGTSCSHRDPDDVAAALEATGEAESMQVTGDWPFA